MATRRIGLIFTALFLVTIQVFAQATPGAKELFNSGPLALRYHILKRAPNGKFVTADPETVFHAGDHIRLTVEANNSSYLYIWQRGSSGQWGSLFSSPETKAMERGREYQVPPDSEFVFDDQSGEERLFIVLSRQPSDISTILGKINPSRSVSLPAKKKPEITDDVIKEVQRQRSRYVLIEKKPPEKTDQGEASNVTYVANTPEQRDGFLVLEVRLRHR